MTVDVGFARGVDNPGEVTRVRLRQRASSGATPGATLVEKADGTELAIQELSFAPAPEDIGRAAGLAGIWVADGGGPTWRLFTNPSLLPLTQRGREAVSTYDETADNQAAECVPYSIPMAMLLPDIKSIEVGPETVVIRGEFDAMVRTIHLNVTSHEGAEAGYQGHWATRRRSHRGRASTSSSSFA